MKQETIEQLEKALSDADIRISELEKSLHERRAEEFPKVSENRFRSIIQKSLDIIIILDQNGIMIYETPSLQSILGYQPGYLIGKSPFEFIHPADLERVANDLSEVYRKINLGVPTEFRVHKPDGTWVYLEAIGQNLLEDPAISGIVITARDITDRKSAEEELKKHRDHLEELVQERTAKLEETIEQLGKEVEERNRVENMLRKSEEIFDIHFSLSDDVMFTNDEEFRFVSVTPNVERVLGYTPEELVGKTFQETRVLHPNDMGRAYDNAQNVLSGGASRHPVYRFITKDGKTIFGEINGVPLIKKGHGSSLISVARDVTQRVLAEEELLRYSDHLEEIVKQRTNELSESEQRFRDLTENTTDWIWESDNQMHTIYSSPRVKDVIGYSQEEVLGKTPLEFLSSEEALRIQASWNEVIPNLQPWRNFEYSIMHKDGSLRVIESSGMPIFDHDGQHIGYRGIDRDVTERKRVEEELKKYRDHLEEQVNHRTEDLARAYEQLKQENDMRKATEIELEKHRKELEEMNATLKVLLRQRDGDKAAMEMNILSNIKTFILPHIEKLEAMDQNDSQRNTISMIRSHLEEITSPFTRNISSEYMAFSPGEIQVASLIRDGKSSKEIASILNISLNTVHTYRYNIRRKAGVKNNKVNLRSYLKGLG
ncbi:MAG: PAS domain S-box protein [Desulfobacterota bacterium]|jgi:PAS domain S-box-containing protein|nr:PAS domain S-box protein [Thermodesulfobacteriota bacterium]